MHQLFNTLPDLILTPNHRLYRTLHSTYNQQQTAPTWRTANILPINTWLQQLWYEAELTQSLPLLLNPQQTLALWEKIIVDASPELANPHATAQLADQAWRLLQKWQIHPQQHDFTLNPDCLNFYQWWQQFAAHCHRHHWIEETAMHNRVIQLLAKKTIPAPATTVLACFDQQTPQLQQLCETLPEVIHFDPDPLTNQSYQATFDDLSDELTHMAYWVKQQLAAGHQSIGCVVPQLSQLRPTLRQVFKRVLPNHTINISLGQTLDSHPIIYTALQTLTLLDDSLPLTTLSYLLRSPYLGSTESIPRAQLDIALRKLGKHHITRTLLMRYATYPTHACPHLQQQLSQSQAPPTTQAPSAWGQYFAQQLHTLGWPGYRSLNSEEQQWVQRWQHMLTEFASLDLILSQITFSQAQHHLTQLTHNLLFQAKTEPTAIHILGILEASGMTFDRLWIQGVDNNDWPAAPHPNPLLPITLQRKHSMPHATAELELDFSQRLITRFQRSAHTTIFSYATQEGEQIIAPSPLIQSLPITDLHNQLTIQQIIPTATLETLADDYGLPQQHISRGGTQLVQYQATCPFRAYAELRLHVRALPLPEVGLNALERGILVHKVLELFWRKTQTQQRLLSYNEQQLNTLLIHCVDQAMHTINNLQLLPQYNMELEAERLHQLCKTWLPTETQRPSFTVKHTEHQQTLTLNATQLTLRVDRIDQLADGTEIIIDYKTGNASPQRWLGERPDDPQLPMYLLNNINVHALLFAQINCSQPQFNGMSAQDTHILGVKTEPEWHTLHQQWRIIFSHLLRDFQNGYAKVDPKDPNKTCRTCQLQALCRVASSRITNI